MKRTRIKRSLLGILLTMSMVVSNFGSVFATGTQPEVQTTTEETTTAVQEVTTEETTEETSSEVTTTEEVEATTEAKKESNKKDKDITLQSDGANKYTITRAATFASISDNNRSWYNPGMFEIAGTSSAKCK